MSDKEKKEKIHKVNFFLPEGVYNRLKESGINLTRYVDKIVWADPLFKRALEAESKAESKG